MSKGLKKLQIELEKNFKYMEEVSGQLGELSDVGHCGFQRPGAEAHQCANISHAREVRG
jgi:hypothetical protein